MNNRELESILKQMESLLDLHGENSFKSRAYGRAARTIRSAAVDIVARVEGGEEIGLDGIGAGLSAEIVEIVRTGTSSQREDLLERTPNGLLDVLSIRGLGSKKVRALWDGLGVESLEDLERAAHAGDVGRLKGFGAKTEQNILSSIRDLKANRGKFRLNRATELSSELHALLSSFSSVQRVETTGRLRRTAEVYALLEFVAVADPLLLVADLERVELIDQVSHDGAILRFLYDANVKVRLHLTTEEQFILARHRTTGSSDYLFMVTIPLEKEGFVIEDDLLKKQGAVVPISSEDELYKLGGMVPIPPELREGIDEVPLALESRLPSPVNRSDMRGLLHVHSTWSDGRNSVEEMAESAQSAGYEYLLMCDHSKAAFYANGLDEKRIEEQGREIDEINKRYDPDGFRVLKGIECDIMADGTLDIDDDILASLDCVVISVHSSFTLPEEAQTDRICRALEHPYSSILAHPTGRLLLTRKGYPVDLKRVVETAAQYDKIVELNANPYRLDLDWRTLRFARRQGVPVAINPDAHATADIAFVECGIAMARKAGLTAGDVLNTLKRDEFLARVQRPRQTDTSN